MHARSLHLIGLIGCRRVQASDLLDHVRFRAACPHSTVSPRGRDVVDPRFHPRRWMMLPEGHGKLRGYVRFFNLSNEASVSTVPLLLPILSLQH